jgi:hypothetical protein
MEVFPGPHDSPEMVNLMRDIELEFKRTVRLKKAMDASIKREGLLRAQLRLMQGGLVEGEPLTLALSGESGTLEISADSPYLWLRLASKSGKPSLRRRKIEDSTVVQRPDGTFPTPAPGHGVERQRLIDRYHSK